MFAASSLCRLYLPIFTRSDHYLPLLDANDLLQDVNKKCMGAIAVLDTFTNYWQKERSTRQQLAWDIPGREDNQHMRAVSSVVTIYDVIRQAWISLEDEDFIKCTKLVLDAEAAFHFLDKNLVPQPLIDHVANSIRNLKHWLDLSARRIFACTDSTEQTVIAALVSICITNRHSSSEETLNFFLQCSSSRENSSGLSDLCVNFFRVICFTAKIIYQAFLNERSDNGLAEVIRKNFPSYPLKSVEREVVISMSQTWLRQQKVILENLITPIFAKKLTIKEILEVLSNLEFTFLGVSKSDWNHFIPLVFSAQLEIWHDFLSPTFREALEEAIKKQVQMCPMKLNHSFPPVNVDMASFIWPGPSQEDSLEMFELRINGICRDYVSASDEVINFLKELVNQCEDLHPEVPIVDAEESKAIKELLVDSLLEHLAQCVEQMKLDVKHNELLTLQAINFTRNLATRGKPLRSFFDLSCDSSKWLKVKSILMDANSEWIETFISDKIEIESRKCLKQLDLNSDWIEVQSVSWDEITITDSSDGENKRRARIKVPLFTSPHLLDFLYKICNFTNKYFAHIVPESASLAICHKLALELTQMYGKILQQLSQTQVSQSNKHKQALQFSFDLMLLKLVFTSCKDNQMKKTLSELSSVLRSFETLVDPFDLHLISKNMQANALQAVKSYMQIFSLILPESSLTFLKKASSTASGTSSSAGVKT